jgi:hypothetical protein
VLCLDLSHGINQLLPGRMLLLLLLLLYLLLQPLMLLLLLPLSHTLALSLLLLLLLLVLLLLEESLRGGLVMWEVHKPHPTHCFLHRMPDVTADLPAWGWEAAQAISSSSRLSSSGSS